MTKQTITQREQLVQLLSFNMKTTLTNSFFALFLAYAQVQALPLRTVLTWLFAILLLNTARFFINRYCYADSEQTPAIVSRRINIFRIGLILSAIVWGMNIFLVMHTNIEQELFIGYLLAGIAAGAALVYSIDFICAIAFAVFSLIPVIIVYFFSGNPFLVLVGVSGLLYLLFLIVSIKTINSRLLEGVLLREDAIKNAEEIKQLAFYDSLTGLPNRRLLMDRLERAFVQSWRTGKRSVVLFLDLDHFKNLNDTLGHDVGDALLVQVAERLTSAVRESDTVSRFGGDEFVLILENLNEEYAVALQEVDQIATVLLGNLNQPYQLVDVDEGYISTPSIGIAMLGEHGRTQQELLKHADIAMYHAKKSGRISASVYDESMKEGDADE